MRFEALAIPGVFLVHPRRQEDERGWFATHFDGEAFRTQGLCTGWAQSASSGNRRRGTLRGLHFQAAPHPETKLVRCNRGAIWDVVVDLRRDSGSFGRWVASELRPETATALYIPEGCAHGYQVLEEESEVAYLISAPYHAEAQRGLRWNDPTVGIRWPLPEAPILSERDRALPLLEAL